MHLSDNLDWTQDDLVYEQLVTDKFGLPGRALLRTSPDRKTN